MRGGERRDMHIVHIKWHRQVDYGSIYSFKIKVQVSLLIGLLVTDCLSSTTSSSPLSSSLPPSPSPSTNGDFITFSRLAKTSLNCNSRSSMVTMVTACLLESLTIEDSIGVTPSTASKLEPHLRQT